MATSPSVETASGQHPPLVLYVDDDENDAFLLQTAARSSKVKLRFKIASDGEEAVKFLEERATADRPQLVLLDLKMPRMNGHEVLQWIRSQETFKDLPVGMFTSSEHAGDVRRSYELGANIFFVKASTFERLVQFLKQLETAFGNGAVDLEPLRADSSFRPAPR